MSQPLPSTRVRLVERLDLPDMPEALLTEALTHASLVNESEDDVRSNERLEFLGDAVLDMVVAHELFLRYPEAGEGDLTRMRAAIVRGDVLGRVGRAIELGDALILGRGEESAGGRTRARNLAGALEAVIGAVFEHAGYEPARDLVIRVLGDEIDGVHAEGHGYDAKSQLQQLSQAKWHEPPQYDTVAEETGEDGRPVFTVEVTVAGEVVGRGSGSRKRDAQQSAAAEAILALEAKGLTADAP